MDWSSFSSCVFFLFLDTSSIAASINVFFLDTFLDKWLDTSRHLYLSRITEDLYICSSWSGSHFLNLSRSVRTCSPPKSLFLTPNIFPKWFSSIFKFLSSLGMSLFSHLHAFHVLKPRFWGFSKLMCYCWNFGMGFCLNEFKISCIAPHYIITVLSCILDVCNWLCAGRIGLGWAHDAISFAYHMFMHPHAYLLLFHYTSYIWTIWSFFYCLFLPPLSLVYISHVCGTKT